VIRVQSEPNDANGVEEDIVSQGMDDNDQFPHDEVDGVVGDIQIGDNIHHDEKEAIDDIAGGDGLHIKAVIPFHEYEKQGVVIDDQLDHRGEEEDKFGEWATHLTFLEIFIVGHDDIFDTEGLQMEEGKAHQVKNEKGADEKEGMMTTPVEKFIF